VPIDLPFEGAVVHQVTTPGLGDHSYLIVVGDRAVVIDPQRDTDRVETLRERTGADLIAVFETHIHNDYLSGGPLLADHSGADYVLPADTGSTLRHSAAADLARFDIGEGWALIAMHTPGHTPHHMAYALVASGGDGAVFSGGSMLVGAVGRCDLVSPDLTERLVRSQYHSVRRLAAALADPAIVGPTHGAGSFCSSTPVVDTVSTIAAEKTRNPALVAADEEAFMRSQLAGYRLYPAYYRHMGPANLAGGTSMPVAALPEMGIAEVAGFLGRIVDLRPAGQYAAGHLPASVNIPAGDTTGIYAGWVFDWNTPLILVGSEEEVETARAHLARIGYDDVAGKVTAGLEPWSAELRTNRVARFADLRAERPAAVLDVRDPKECAADGAHEDAIVMHIAEVPGRVAELPSGEVWVYCASGYRAAMAVGFLEAAGRTPVLVADHWGN
jgi:glyoxylase-like metal-dependent hydrolase (beta-lactamase superfamily II)/rhodanese-related sulfurtransferase